MLGQQTLASDAELQQHAARTQAARIVHGLMEGNDPFSAGLGIAQSLHVAQHGQKQARAQLTPDEALNLPEDEQILGKDQLLMPSMEELFLALQGLRPR